MNLAQVRACPAWLRVICHAVVQFGNAAGPLVAMFRSGRSSELVKRSGQTNWSGELMLEALVK